MEKLEGIDGRRDRKLNKMRAWAKWRENESNCIVPKQEKQSSAMKASIKYQNGESQTIIVEFLYFGNSGLPHILPQQLKQIILDP